MNEKRKQKLVKKYKDLGHSLEGLDSCLHGNKLFKTCISCGRYINKDGKVIWDAKGKWEDVPDDIIKKIKEEG